MLIVIAKVQVLLHWLCVCVCVSQEEKYKPHLKFRHLLHLSLSQRINKHKVSSCLLLPLYISCLHSALNFLHCPLSVFISALLRKCTSSIPIPLDPISKCKSWVETRQISAEGPRPDYTPAKLLVDYSDSCSLTASSRKLAILF